MNLVHRISERLAHPSTPKPAPRFRISNLTRDTVLARRAELADNESTRRKGLLGRDGLAPGEALWILPCEAVHTFGMKFPIDLVYIDRKQRVRKVRSAVPPWRMSLCFTAHSVIELAAGAVRDSKTAPGDTIEFSAAD